MINNSEAIQEEGTSSKSKSWLMLLSVAVSVGVFLLSASLPMQQRLVAAIFSLSVALWMTEALPLAVTSLLSTCLLIITGATESKSAFGAYGDQLILLFVGSFIIAKAMEDSGLDRRITYWILNLRWATSSASSILLSLGIVSCLISLFVSNTATTAMLLPIGRTILRAMGVDRRGHPIATSVLLMLTWGSSVAVGTIIGTPPNVLGVSQLRKACGVSLNFVQWATFAMPITIALLAIAWLQLRIWKGVEKPNTAQAKALARHELQGMGPLADAEWATVVAFFAALVLWLLPGIIQYAVGAEDPLSKQWASRVPEAVAALVGASVLFLWPCRERKGEMAMSWRSAARIDWGIILLFAGGLALGVAVNESGLAKVLGTALASAMGVHDVWPITALCIALGIVLSELASNTAAATTVTPIAIALSQGAHINPVAPVLGAVLGTNFGFMLPISTPPNAIVYSSGLIPASVMLRTGIIFDVVGWLVTYLSLYLILPLMNLA